MSILACTEILLITAGEGQRYLTLSNFNFQGLFDCLVLYHIMNMKLCK